MARLIATVAFSGDSPELNVGQAIAELDAAGYAVRRMPERYRSRMVVPGDYYIEVTAIGPADDNDIWWHIESIVSKHGGVADEFGAVDSDYVPFADTFGEINFPEPPDMSERQRMIDETLDALSDPDERYRPIINVTIAMLRRGLVVRDAEGRFTLTTLANIERR
jgi:hypothetical protein